MIVRINCMDKDYYFQDVLKIKSFRDNGILDRVGLNFKDKTKSYEEIKCYGVCVYTDSGIII